MPEFIPANQPITVILARNSTAAASALVSRPAVAVVPYSSTWNDFGRYLYAKLWIFSLDGAATELGLRFMFEGAPRTDAHVTQILGTRDWIDIAEVNTPFCSVFDDIKSYDTIVRILGFAQAVTALRSLGDAVVLRLEGINSARLALLDTQDFHFGALRQESTFVAFRRGARYLRPPPLAIVNDAARSFSLEAKLPSADNNYEIEFDFEPDELVRNRLSVLIGKNGSGKTQLLLKIIESLRTYPDADQTARFVVSPSFNRILVFSSVASDPYPRAIPPWQCLDYQYFSMIASPAAEQDALTSALVDCLRDDGQIQFFEGEPFTPRGRLALLERSMTSLGVWSSIYLPLKLQDAEYDLPPPLIWNGRPFFPLARARTLNEQRRLLLVQALDWAQSPLMFGSGDQPRNLSSGEFAMFRFAAQAAGSVEKGCIFLFDEPETHLHPNFISDLMDILHTLLTVTQSAAIIATHSAYIVRESTTSARQTLVNRESRSVYRYASTTDVRSKHR